VRTRRQVRSSMRTRARRGGSSLFYYALRCCYLWVRIRFARLMGHKVQGKTQAALWNPHWEPKTMEAGYLQPYNDADVQISMYLLSAPQLDYKPRLRDRVREFLHRLREALAQL
jgi:hypothetical protein